MYRGCIESCGQATVLSSLPFFKIKIFKFLNVLVVVVLLLVKHECPKHLKKCNLRARWPENVVNFQFFISSTKGQLFEEKKCQQNPKQIKKLIKKCLKSLKRKKKSCASHSSRASRASRKGHLLNTWIRRFFHCLPTLSQICFKSTCNTGKESITQPQTLSLQYYIAMKSILLCLHQLIEHLSTGKESLTRQFFHCLPSLSLTGCDLSFSISKESLTQLHNLSLHCCKATLSILLCLYLLLVAQGIERNPGPFTNYVSQDKIVSISTYNVQGLSIASHKGMQKFRKIINLCKNNTSNTNVICLQETHLIDLNYLKKVWQSEFIVSNGTRASRGVAILLGKDIKIVNKLQCEEGRFAICKVKNDLVQMNTFVANIYAPNNHNVSLDFYRNFFDVFEKFIDDNSIENEEFDICITGDFNFVTNPSDCKNRILHQQKLN
jgi:hypothetical protein